MLTLLEKYKRYLLILFVALSVISLSVTYVFYKINTQKIAEETLSAEQDSLAKQLTLQKKNLESIIIDWAVWDDSYEFVKGVNRQKYIKSNFGGNKTLLNTHINGMIFLDNNYNMLYGRIVENSKEKELQVLPALLRHYMGKFAHSKKTIFMDYMKDGKILILLSLPITPSIQKDKSDGILVVYKILTADDFMGAESLHVKIIGGVKQSRYRLENSSTLLLCNVFQGSSSNFCIQRTIESVVLETLYHSTIYMIALIIFISLLAAVIMYILLTPTLNKITRLSNSIADIYKSKKIKNLPSFEAQELAALTNDIEHTVKDLLDILHHLPLIAYKVRIYKEGNFEITISDAVEEVTGFTKEEVESNKMWWQEHIYEADKERVLKAQNELMKQGCFEHQYRFTCKDGYYIWINDKLINRNKGDKLVDVLGFWDDITTLKLHEASSKALAEINRYFLIQNNEDEIMQGICKELVKSEFCDKAIIECPLGKSYSYGDANVEESTAHKNLEVDYNHKTLKIKCYSLAKRSDVRVLEEVFVNIKNNIESGFKALLEEKELKYLTYHSSICDCPNTNALNVKIQERTKPFALIMMNIRSFSSINLLYGFEFGNKVLRKVGDTLINSLRETDIVYHLEGDKYCVLIDRDDKENLEKIAKKMVNECAKFVIVEGRHIPVNCRFGVAKYPEDSDKNIQIRDFAMTALSHANKHKKEIVIYEDGMKETLNSYRDTEVTLLDAIEHKKFEFYYQPIVDVKTQKTMHCEALIRLKDANGNPMSPEFFIHVAEELGLIKKITKIVVEAVANQQQIWKKKGLHVKVALNLSSYDIEDENFIGFFEETLIKHGLINESIAVEITERTAVKNYDAARNFLQRMKELGISVEIDDFGVAHSSLHQITQMEFDTLKIDKSFVDKLLIDEKDREIVNVIIKMSKILNVTTLAEGVETKEQYKWLKEKGCELIQGYYFSKPLSVMDFEEYMSSTVS